MKLFDWDDAKNAWLKVERGISFEEIVFLILTDNLIDIVRNKNDTYYPGQQIMVVNVDGYVHLVPFDETDDTIFLRTIIPSRKATKQYLGGAS